MDCTWVRKQLSKYLKSKGARFLKRSGDSPEAGFLDRHEREERVRRLEMGLRQTLQAVAEREFLRAEERAAILSRLTMEMARWKPVSRSLRLAWSWLGATILLALPLFSLAAPQAGIPVSVQAAQVTPAARIATYLEAQRPVKPTITLSTTPLQPTAWPAMELPLSRAKETTYPRGTTQEESR